MPDVSVSSVSRGVGRTVLHRYGFELEPCLATGCTEIMLNNKDCDDACNHLECEYDLGLCFKVCQQSGVSGCPGVIDRSSGRPGSFSTTTGTAGTSRAATSMAAPKTCCSTTSATRTAIPTSGASPVTAHAHVTPHFQQWCGAGGSHSDNWRCVSHDEYQLYDSMGNGWDEHLPM